MYLSQSSGGSTMCISESMIRNPFFMVSTSCGGWRVRAVYAPSPCPLPLDGGEGLPALCSRRHPDVEAQEAPGVFAQNLLLRADGEAVHVLAQRLDGAGEDGVPVGIVGRPAHVILPDVVHDGGDRGLVGVARDHALPAEVLAGLHREPGDLVGPLLVVLVHPVQPERQPRAPGFEERHLEPREPLEHAAAMIDSAASICSNGREIMCVMKKLS